MKQGLEARKHLNLIGLTLFSKASKLFVTAGTARPVQCLARAQRQSFDSQHRLGHALSPSRPDCHSESAYSTLSSVQFFPRGQRCPITKLSNHFHQALMLSILEIHLQTPKSFPGVVFLFTCINLLKSN
jgi:hypothetical protein